MEHLKNEYNIIFQKNLNNFFRNFLYLLMSLPFGIIYFTFAVTGISLGIALSIIYIGVPVLGITLLCAEKIIQIEKGMARKILDSNIREIHGNINLNKDVRLIKGMIGVIKDPSKWKNIFYCIIKLPISIMHFTVVTCIMTLSLGITFQPIIYEISKSFGIDIYKDSITIGKLLGFANANYVDLFLSPILGILIVFVSIKIINTLAEKWAEFTLKF